MGPKLRKNANELILCDICGCLFANKDTSLHSDVCTQSEPWEMSLPDYTVDDNSFCCHKCPHGLVFQQILLGKLEEIKTKDVPDHFPKNLGGRVIQLSPVMMTYLHISIGQPVVLNGLYAFPAWPCPVMASTSVRVSPEVLADMSYTGSIMMVQPLESPRVDALTLHCEIRNIGDFHSKMKPLREYIVRVSVGRHVTRGSHVNIDYYGQSCDVSISAVHGVDNTSAEHVETHQEQDSVDLESISDEVSRLSLGTDNSDIASTPVHPGIASTPVHPGIASTPVHPGIVSTLMHPGIASSPLNPGIASTPVHPGIASTPVKATRLSRQRRRDPSVIPRFYRISHSTKLVIVNEDVFDPKRVVSGPKLADFGGFHQQIETLKDAISSHLFKSDILAAQGLSSPGGMLLYGPSGGGKTMMIHAVANDFPVPFITINGAEVWSKFYGESEAKLVSLFKEAQMRAPSIVFLDEIDALCPKRENSKNEVEKRVVATLLTILDGLTSSKKKVFIIAATNKRQDVDGAMRRPGRLDRELEIGVPPVNDRIEILEKLLHRTNHGIAADVLRDVAERAHGFLGSDLAAICKQATLRALKRVSAIDDGGELKLVADDITHGLQTVKPSAMKEVTLEVSKVSWSDIGGQEELKHKLRQAVEWPLKHPEAFSRLGIRPPRGLLMYGPPGCSKTMIAKALARESGLNFIAIKGPELFSKWVGESEKAVREVFHRARSAAPAIVFFDEIDALAGERGGHGGGGGDVSDRVLAQLLTEMDGVEALEDILVVAATNRPDRIDKALMRPGRLDRIIYVPLPDTATREAIFMIHCRRTPVGGDVDISQLVTATDGYSGAEVSAVCHEAALAALEEDINSRCVYNSHFCQALTVVKPRITPQLLAIYDKYRAQGSAFS